MSFFKSVFSPLKAVVDLTSELTGFGQEGQAGLGIGSGLAPETEEEIRAKESALLEKKRRVTPGLQQQTMLNPLFTGR